MVMEGSMEAALAVAVVTAAAAVVAMAAAVALLQLRGIGHSFHLQNSTPTHSTLRCGKRKRQDSPTHAPYTFALGWRQSPCRNEDPTI